MKEVIKTLLETAKKSGLTEDEMMEIVSSVFKIKKTTKKTPVTKKETVEIVSKIQTKSGPVKWSGNKFNPKDYVSYKDQEIEKEPTPKIEKAKRDRASAQYENVRCDICNKTFKISSKLLESVSVYKCSKCLTGA